MVVVLLSFSPENTWKNVELDRMQMCFRSTLIKLFFFYYSSFPSWKTPITIHTVKRTVLTRKHRDWGNCKRTIFF